MPSHQENLEWQQRLGLWFFHALVIPLIDFRASPALTFCSSQKLVHSFQHTPSTYLRANTQWLISHEPASAELAALCPQMCTQQSCLGA